MWKEISNWLIGKARVTFLKISKINNFIKNNKNPNRRVGQAKKIITAVVYWLTTMNFQSYMSISELIAEYTSLSTHSPIFFWKYNWLFFCSI